MLLDALRSNTRPAHDRLEAQLGLLRPELTLGRYRELLERQYRLYRPLEAQLGQVIPAEWQAALEWPARQKTGLLAADLRALGVRLPAPDRTLRLPPVSGEAAAWGALYVLEGATLGGQILCRHLGPQLGLREDAGLSFYASYGTLVGPRWKSFLALLDRRHGEAGAQAADFQASAVQGANETFACFGRWLAPALAAPHRGVA